MSGIGALFILGSEGLGPDFVSVWRGIFALAPASSIAHLPMPVPNRSYNYALRPGRYQDIFANAGVELIGVRSSETAIAEIETAQSILLSSSIPNPIHFDDDLSSNDPCLAVWTECSKALLKGKNLILSASVAGEAGAFVFAPIKPYRPDVSQQEFIVTRAARLIPGTAVLIYFDMVSAPLVACLTSLLPSDTILLGIDQTAAVAVAEDQITCVGLGKVTLLRDNELVWCGSDGDAIPSRLIHAEFGR